MGLRRSNGQKHGSAASRPLRTAACLCVLASLFLCLASRQAQAGDPFGDWWDSRWSHRQVVQIATPDPTNAINTALAVIDTENQCAKDGRDLRVMDGAGRVMSHKVLANEDGVVRLEFQLPDAAARRYFIYYGNPQAKTVAHSWAHKVGGLRLATWSNTLRRNAHDWPHFKKLLKASKWKHNEGPRTKISDAENPFGPDDQYLSVYTGQIFCPVDGTYVFVTNSDDSSFLSVNGQLVAQWPGGHNPAPDWNAAAKKGASGKITLKRGIHKIEYHHVETRGGQLARAGWKPPGEKAFVTIPEEGFIRELRTVALARQARHKPLNAYFEAREIDALRFAKLDAKLDCKFTTVRLEDRSCSTFGEVKLFVWDFGDGTTSRERNPVHEYTRSGVFRVSLTVRDRLGMADTCTRSINIGHREPRRVTVFMEVKEAESVLMPRQRTEVRVDLKNTGLHALPVTLIYRITTERPEGGPSPVLLLRERESLSLAPNQWLKRTRTVDGSVDSGHVHFELAYRGVPIAKRSLRLLPADGRGGHIKVRNNGFEDERGHRVVLRLLPYVSVPPADPLSERLARGAPVRVVVVDDSLGTPAIGKTAQSYTDLFCRRLRKQFPDAPVSVKHIGTEALKGYAPLARLAAVPSLVAKAKPHLVILAGSVEDVLNYLPVNQFERNLLALIDRIRGATGAEMLLITPPPLVINPDLSRDYAEATKRVALRRDVPVADAYSAFTVRGERWKELYRDPDDSERVYYLAPNSEGQQLIAREVYDRLLGRTWWLRRKRR